MKLDYGSFQESACIFWWKKKQRVELLHTIANIVASINPDKAKQALDDLIEEMFPEQKFEKQKSVDRALKIMEEERKKVFAVTPLVPAKPKGLIQKVNKVLKRGR